ncbi:NAD-dependent epimerase/dehydratase family protein [Maribacter sp. 2210JD10-5]|uniref:NAD-dependent epimerase/dehydratase family protein n=1 Tax=Maribacter sp. 2210JD10-5 TaxID=3386272 RepID=UPI0039BCA6A5
MVLVTGGTGLVGSHLLLELVKTGISTRAIYRSETKLREVKKVFGYYTENPDELFERIEWVIADILDIPALTEAFEGITHVYHAAALISFDPNDFNRLQKTNVEGTANVVNLCIANNVKKLCYVSTIGTIGRSTGDTKANEETEWSAMNTNVYSISKHMAEMEVWRGSQESLSVVIVNPGVIIGPGFWETGSGKLFKTVNKGYGFYPPGGTGFVSVNDVVRGMIRLMNSPIVNERYIMVAENLSFKSILAKIAPKLGEKTPGKVLKIWQLQIARYGDWLVNLLTRRGRRITRNTIYSLKNPEYYDNSKIKTILNFKFEPLEKSIAFSAAKFIEQHQ